MFYAIATQGTVPCVTQGTVPCVTLPCVLPVFSVNVDIKYPHRVFFLHGLLYYNNEPILY